MTPTPGPWTVFYNDHELTIRSKCDTNRIVANLTNSRNLANAKLIASAPEMMSALERCLKHLEARDAVHYHGDTEMTALLRGVIAKSKGETNG